jgi:hypothetical protein
MIDISYIKAAVEDREKEIFLTIVKIIVSL